MSEIRTEKRPFKQQWQTSKLLQNSSSMRLAEIIVSLIQQFPSYCPVNRNGIITVNWIWLGRWKINLLKNILSSFVFLLRGCLFGIGECHFKRLKKIIEELSVNVNFLKLPPNKAWRVLYFFSHRLIENRHFKCRDMQDTIRRIFHLANDAEQVNNPSDSLLEDVERR